MLPESRIKIQICSPLATDWIYYLKNLNGYILPGTLKVAGHRSLKLLNIWPIYLDAAAGGTIDKILSAYNTVQTP